ncbi:exosortase A [Parasphingopyxis sp.]|uniref:exosortase A n=1 Tax=Parasphingopyxis sp. TaxID=1920299 RepID=UPI0026290B89|nr:exosortase A [Parasphingopyxis sp.]
MTTPAMPKAVAGAWRVHLAVLAAVFAALGILFRADIASMATIWWTSETFNHCFLILPIIGWLVWQRRAELAQLQPSIWTPGLAVVAIGAAGWLVAEAGSIGVGRHLGVVVMLQGSVIAILGRAVTRGLLFPLGYALFLVPFGQEFVPALQAITADLSMMLLGLFGIPAHIEGVFITTPFGYFEVAEACSGVKFLIAMAALGALAANLCFRTWQKRVAFMALCLAVPIVANGIRAFGTIYLARIYGIEFAESADHVVYGWFFFAFVIAVVFAIGWKFFDRELDDPAFDPADIGTDSAPVKSNATIAGIAALVLGIAAAPMLWLTATAATGTDAPAMRLPAVEGWERTDAAMRYPWQATYLGADRIVEGRYRNAEGQIVDIAIGYFANQSGGRDVVGRGQGGLPPESEWSRIEDLPAPESASAYRIVAPGPVSRIIFEYSWIGGEWISGTRQAKLETMRARLFGGDQRAIGVTVSAEGDDARAVMHAFLADAGGVESLVDRAVRLAD